MRTIKLLKVTRLVCCLVILGGFATVSLAESVEVQNGAVAAASSYSKVEPFDAQSSVLRMVGGLFLCLGLFGFGMHLFKRYGIPRGMVTQRRMKVVERLQLSSKSSLILVNVDGRELLISAGAEASRLIGAPDCKDALFKEALSEAANELGGYDG